MKKIISAGGIIINDQGQVALIQNQKGKWGFPKGHIEAGEDAIDAAKREIYEEAGIDVLHLIKDLGLLMHMKPFLFEQSRKTDVKYIQMFLFKSNQKELGPNDSEIKEAKWISLDSVSKVLKFKEDREFYLKNLEEIKSAI